jgi:hypothetical protein
MQAEGVGGGKPGAKPCITYPLRSKANPPGGLPYRTRLGITSKMGGQGATNSEGGYYAHPLAWHLLRSLSLPLGI